MMLNFDVMVAGLPLVVVVLGLVEFVKRFGVSGMWLLGFSMLLGVGFGVGYIVSVSGLPVGFGGWFEAIVFGLGLGLVASGVYDVVTKRNKESDNPGV